MISCEEATIICNKTQYNDASFLEKLKLRFHLLVCKACSAFSKKNGQLTALCEKAQMKQLSEEEKVRMKSKLKNKY